MKFDYAWMGWCQEGTSDKVWVLLVLERYGWGGIKRHATIWGRRGKRLQSKVYEEQYTDPAEQIVEKQRKGYKPIDKQKLDQVYPEFEQDLEKAAFWAVLKA